MKSQMAGKTRHRPGTFFGLFQAECKRQCVPCAVSRAGGWPNPISEKGLHDTLQPVCETILLIDPDGERPNHAIAPLTAGLGMDTIFPEGKALCVFSSTARNVARHKPPTP
jgi:hypothetical protein